MHQGADPQKSNQDLCDLVLTTESFRWFSVQAWLLEFA